MPNLSKNNIKQEPFDKDYFKSNNIKISDIIDLTNMVDFEDIVDITSNSEINSVEWIDISSVNSCRGCIENLENQEGHMDYGGCLYVKDDDSVSDEKEEHTSFKTEKYETEISDNLIYTRVI